VKAFQIQDDWSIEHIRLADLPDPQPGPRQVMLRMKAASLNFRDLVVPQRGYGALTGTLPLIPVSDGVGEVVAVGPGVSRVSIGERVCPMFMQKWTAGPPTRERITATLGGPIDGVMAEYRVFDEQAVARVPAHLSDEEAATLPCAALTAWSALVTDGDVRPGDSVLIQGTGGVSLFALQFAKLLGARAIVLSSSDEKLERARALGADAGINYKFQPDWSGSVRAAAGGDGVDHIVEVGGQKTLPLSLKVIRPGGTISMIGVLSGGVLDARLGLVVTRYVRLQGITVGHRDGFESMARAVEQHRLRPVIDRVFAFEQFRAAMDHLKSGAQFGKVCLRHPG
jgi:NADPH:quinone reductase-like Zn-dependent oxidoreductase